MATQLEVIQKFMRSLDKQTKYFGEEALDDAINAASPTSSIKYLQDDSKDRDIKSHFLADLTSTKNVEYFLRVYCGIDFSTKDSGAITGSDAGGKQIKDESDIILESNNVNTSFQNTSFSVNDLSVELADNKTFSSLSNSEKFIWQGLYTWWMEGALNLIAESYGENFGFGKKSSTSTNKMYVEFINDPNADKISLADPMDESNPTYNETTGEITSLKLIINMYYYNGLENDLEKANTEFDRTLAHELTHAVMMANVLYFPVYRSLPGFITEGLAELTIGIKNTNADKIKALAADVSKFRVGLDANDVGRDESFMYEGGYIFFRYMARQFGDLTIANSSTANTLLLTFYGDDTIESYANKVTISSGEGDDSIKASGNKLKINSSDGRDTITLYENSSNNSIDLGEGNDFVSLLSNSSNNTVIGGDGNDLIYNGSTNALINGEKGADFISIQLDAKNNTVNGGKGNDTIEVRSEAALINGDDDKDYIYLYSTANKNTVNGGTGNDYIYIYENSQNHKITSGDGGDTVHSEGTNILVDTGNGKDVIQLYSKDSSAKNNTINSGADNDSIYGGGSNISINADAGDDYIHVYSSAENITISPGAGNDTIESYCENGFLYKYAKGDGNDSIKGFSSKDTLSISGTTYSTTKSGSNIVVTAGSGKITLEGAAKLSKLNIVKGSNSTTSATLNVTNSTKSPVIVDSAVKVINASKRTKAVDITGNDSANTISGGSKNDTLYGGGGNDSIIGNKGNDLIYGDDGNDTLIGGSGNDTLTGGDGADVFICGTGKDVITDYETDDKISLSAAITKATVSGNDVIFTMDKNSVTVKDGKGKSLSLINSKGKSFSTVLGGSTSSTLLTVTNSTKSPVTVGSAVKVINASKRTKAVKITGNIIANTISGGSGKDTIYGGKGDDSLIGNKGSDKLYGQAGNDTLRGNSGNDTLYGGEGKDIFICGSGKDVITDYESGDKISLSAAITKATVSGNDVVFTLNKNSLTVKNGKGKKLTVIGTDGKETTKTYGSSTTSTLLAVTDSTSSPVTVGSSIKLIDASARTKTVKITGNSSANTILGGSNKDTLYGEGGNDSLVGNAGNDKLYGGVGDDTLTGGKGNDSLWGDAGKDTFIYEKGSGKDVIYDFADDDMLKITGDFSTSYNKSKDKIYFKVGSTENAITLEDFTATTFNINGTNYEMKNTKLVSK